MRAVIQRVTKATININSSINREIKQGLVILIGIEDADNSEDIKWLTKKILNLRIFDDENGVMNKSVIDIEGEILLVSQFTLHASTKKGNRPSYIKAAKPEIAIPLYEETIFEFKKQFSKEIATGEFGADMKINLENDGPVTIIIDSKNKE
jgi:D-tyrosyl-tRNA(Tyr) deacylase